MGKTKRILPWITAALILVVSVLLVVACIRIYQSGSRPFNREIIGAYASQIRLIGWICLLAVIAGFFIPVPKEKRKARKDLKDQVKRYEPVTPEAIKERKLRKRLCVIRNACLLLLAVNPVVYLTDPQHFSVSDVNGDIFRAAVIMLIPGVFALILSLVFRRMEFASISREIESAKSCGIKPGPVQKAEGSTSSRKWIRGCLLGIGILFVIVGALNGGAADVLGKAIRICTECIGLG